MRRPSRWLLLGGVAGVGLLSACGWFAGLFGPNRGPMEPTEIFPGVTYGCRRLPELATASGLVHWAEIDLSTPGLELYVTPVDATLVPEGYQYRLRYVGRVARTEKLSVAVNACLFTDANRVHLPGTGPGGWRPSSPMAR